MAACPVCFGDGHLDLSDIDALIGEHWTDAQIADAKAQGMVHPVGVVACDECEGTGVVSEARALELRAVALARVDQVVAKLYDARPQLGGMR